MVQYLGEEHLPLAQFELAACNAAHVQQIIHQAHQVRHLAIHHADRLRDCRIRIRPQLEDVQAVAQRGERVAQFVREDG